MAVLLVPACTLLAACAGAQVDRTASPLALELSASNDVAQVAVPIAIYVEKVDVHVFMKVEEKHR